MISVDVVLPAWPIARIRPLLRGGTQAWLAGGAVRDLLLERSPHDWDFVITGSGLHLARAVADELGGAYYALDPERQTGRALVPDPVSNLRIMLDFATLRDDTIVQDLLTRDFTVNAMALDLDGRLIDPTGGHRDLKDHILRMVSPGCFAADSVRLLRAVRLVTQLALTLEEETRTRIQAEAPLVTATAPERIRAELVALLSLPTAAAGLALLAELRLLEHVFPELDQTAGPDEIQRRIAVVASSIRLQRSLMPPQADPCDEVDPACALVRAHPDTLEALNAYLAESVGAEVTRGELIRWAALFTSTAPSPGADAIVECLVEQRMSELHFSRAAIDFVRLIVASRGAFQQLTASGVLTKRGSPESSATRRAIYRYYRDAREAGIAVAILALASYETSSAPHPAKSWGVYVDTARVLIEAYLTQRGEYIDPPPLLSGHDMLALGIPQGPPVGEAIALLREAQATGEVHTQTQARAFVLRTLQPSEDSSPPSSGEPI